MKEKISPESNWDDSDEWGPNDVYVFDRIASLPQNVLIINTNFWIRLQIGDNEVLFGGSRHDKYR